MMTLKPTPPIDVETDDATVSRRELLAKLDRLLDEAAEAVQEARQYFREAKDDS